MLGRLVVWPCFFSAETRLPRLVRARKKKNALFRRIYVFFVFCILPACSFAPLVFGDRFEVCEVQDVMLRQRYGAGNPAVYCCLLRDFVWEERQRRKRPQICTFGPLP